MADHAKPAPTPHAAPDDAHPAVRRGSGGIRQLGQWIKKHPLRALATAVLISSVPLVLWLASVYLVPPEVEANRTIADALRAIEEEKFTDAKQIAMQLKANSKASYREGGEPFYILGLSLAHDASQHEHVQEKRLLYHLAAKYLQESSEREFPVGHESEGYFQLGQCWHQAGEYAKAISALKKSDSTDARIVRETHQLLAESYLRLDPPRCREALRENDAFLADKELLPLDRKQGQLRTCRILLANGDLEKCWEQLATIKSRQFIAEVGILQGKVLLAQGTALLAADPADEAAANLRFREAVETLRAIANSDDSQHAPPAEAQLLLGIAYQRMNDLPAAEAQFARVRKSYAGSSEKLPAALFEVELLVDRKSYGEAVQLALKSLQETPPAGLAHNPWLSPSKLQQRLSNLHRELLEANAYDEALALIEAPTSFVSAWQSSLWKAQCHEARATHFEREAEQVTLEKANLAWAKARADRRMAGIEYQRLAQLREATSQYTEDLWRSAEQSFAGRDYPRCATSIRNYLRNESKKRRPDALLLLGQSHLALGNYDLAIQLMEECLAAFPKHPVAYRARIIAAQAHGEKGNLAAGTALLSENVASDALSPRSAEWRDALFLLGALQYREGVEWEAKSRLAGIDSEDPETSRNATADLEKAEVALRNSILNLDKAVQRYPEANQAKHSKFLLADAYRQAAKSPRKRLRSASLEAVRLSLSRQAKNDLQKAVDHYEQLIAELGEIQESTNHTVFDKRLLRNCCFAKADALFDLGRHDDAIKAYSAATNRYQSQPESLEAYVQIAACHRILERPREARVTLEQAKLALTRMKDDVPFTQATPYTRDEWNQLLTWLATL